MSKNISDEGPTVHLRRLEDGDDVAVSLEEFENLIRRGEVGPQTKVRFSLVTGEHWVAAEGLEIFRGLYSPDRIVFQEQFNLSRFPIVTALVVIANVIAFLFLQHARLWYGAEAPLVLGAKAAPLIEEAGQLWRLLSYSFVHADRFHLLTNMAFLLLLGLALENAFSRRSFLLIMTASGVCSGLASYFLTEQPSAGASGIVFGILGALVVFGIKYRTLIPRPYTYYFGWSVLPLLLITIYAGFTQPLVDNWGHFGGLVGGVLASMVLPAEVLENQAVAVSGWAIAGAALLAVAMLSIFGAPIVSRVFLGKSTFEDELGLSLSYPETWNHQTYDDYGYVLIRHESYPYLHMTVGSIERDHEVDPHEAMSERLRLEVLLAEERGDLDAVSRFRRRRLRIAGHPAEVATYTFRTERRRYHREVYIIANERREHTLSFSTLEPWREPYARIFSEVIASVQITSPRRGRHHMDENPTIPTLN